jgi:hypothetical protein
MAADNDKAFGALTISPMCDFARRAWELRRVNLILFDAQFLARDSRELVGPTMAGLPELALRERIATRAATRPRLDLDDVKAGALKRCSQRGDLETELQGTRHDTGEPADLKCDAAYTAALRVRSHRLDDILCQRQLVHFIQASVAVDAPLNNRCRLQINAYPW